ncbi:MAG: hypothetical protein ACJA08_001011 [Cyclobacteriaceae bacterium]|jgi:hypothetical protein
MNPKMKAFFEKIISTNGIVAPISCDQSFSQNFTGAIKVEWSKTDNCYEAVFYLNNLEHIAIFSLDGLLIEYRMILPDGYLPEQIKNKLEDMGEIMNKILINKGNSLIYEIIVRDKNLVRSLVLMTDLGVVIEEKRL